MAEPSDTALGEPTMAKPNVTKPTAMATNIDNKPSLPLTGEPQEPGQSVPQESDQSLLPTTEPKKPLPLTRKNLALLNTLNGDSKRKKHSSYFESDTMTISTTTSGFAEKAYNRTKTAVSQPH